MTWRCGANAWTYRSGNVGAPVTPERRERRYFDYGQVHRRCYARCLRFVDAVDASDASDCPDTTPTRRALASKPAGSTEWQLDTLNWLVGVVVVGANARTYEQRMDRRMRRTKIRQGDALEVPSERRITIRTTTALTNTSLKGFCICSSCRRCGCWYKVTNRTARALALGLNACSPSSLGRGALPVVGRHPNYPTVHL